MPFWKMGGSSLILLHFRQK